MAFMDIVGSLYMDARRRYIEALRNNWDAAPVLVQIEAMEEQFAGVLVGLMKTRRRESAGEAGGVLLPCSQVGLSLPARAGIG